MTVSLPGLVDVIVPSPSTSVSTVAVTDGRSKYVKSWLVDVFSIVLLIILSRLIVGGATI